MNRRVFKADALLLLTAAVWGFGFVAQRSGMRYVGPFTFNGIRFILGSLSLLPLIVRRKHAAGQRDTSPYSDSSGHVDSRRHFHGSFLAGSCLFVAVTFQQLGMMFTTAGNAGFITGLYVIFTPVFGIFLGRKTGRATWIGAILTLTGLYFLSTANPLGGINPGDVIIVISAVLWTFHVLIIDRVVQKSDPLVISSGQFAIAGLFALGAAFLIEPSLLSWLEGRRGLSGGLVSWLSFPALISGLGSGAVPFSLVSDALVPILYGGLVSVGIGYTLQAVAQRDAPPAHAAIILCLEGCFAALGGILLLDESAGTRTLVGFVFALAGMLASQWELIRGRPRK